MIDVNEKEQDCAISPVVGVMLMLVVTIVIAAVISSFAGGLIGSEDKAPMLAMDVNIKNNGYWTGSSFCARVTGIEKAIPTSDLKIVTKWTKVYSNGTTVDGGATVLPGVNNTFVYYSPWNGCNYRHDYAYVAPLGFGVGTGEDGEHTGTGSGMISGPMRTVDPDNSSSPRIVEGELYKDTQFGYYSLGIGSVMWAEPFGASARPTAGGYVGYPIGYGCNGNRWNYEEGESASGGTPCAKFHLPENQAQVDSRDAHVDGMMAVLGWNWYILKPGDVVTVTVVHTPTGKTIWQKDVIVEG